MRVRKLALAVGLVSALGGNAALALGLGEIKLNSTLNQPLNAEINLLQTRGLGDNEIKVRLASPEDFERAGVDRSYLLTELRFEVDYSGAQPVIRVSSREPIREPFLNFLVETRWPSGRLLREYTLLMDLPAFSTSVAQQPVRAAERERQQVRREAPVQRPVQQPAVRPAEPEPVAEPQPVEVREQQPTQQQADEPVELRPQAQTAAAEESPAGESSRVYGPVSANQTLWEIAVNNRVSREFSVQQTMLAIQRLNPEAFINNNINLLKKGAVLRLPNAQDVRALSLSEAVSEVATQNESWRQRIGGDTATGAPLDARAVAEDTSSGETVEGRVSLAAPGDNESVTSGSGSGAEDSEALAGDLTVAEEELDKSRLENEELQERIAELDEQIDTMERMVEVSNEEMRAVQAAAEQSEPSANPMEVGDGEAAAESSEETVAGEETVADTTAEPAVAEEPATQDDSRNRVVVQTKSEPTLMERLMENIQLIGIGAGVLLVGLFGFFTWRRRKEEEEAMLQVEREMLSERELAEAPGLGEQSEELSALEGMPGEDDFDLGELDDVGTDDPISEAEIHLSLGQYDEAESKLLLGLDQDGQNVDARLMLLEVYAHQQNADKFDEHYRQLLSVSDGPAADRAARLRETIAGAAPFEAPSMDFTSESLEAAQLDDISASFEDDFASESFDSASFDGDSATADSGSDFGGELGDDTSLLDDLTMDLSSDGDSAAGESGDDDLSLDLDLDMDTGFDSEVPSGQGAQSDSSEDDFSLDLGLDGGFDSEAPAEQGVQADSEQDEFNLDDLDLGDLELGDSDDSQELGPIDFESAGLESGEADSVELDNMQPESAEQTGNDDFDGLDFDLDLSPMETADELQLEAGEPQADDHVDAAAARDTAELSLDDIGDDELKSIGGELDDSLDLDSVDLDDIASSLPGDEELSLEGDTAVAVASEQPSAGVSQPSAAEDSEADFGDLGFNLESDLDSELNLLDGTDEISTKLELAQAYLDMGDKDGAKDILSEVVQEGAGEHKARAEEMLERMA
ncbi:FimV/HubP family polar landmark protein [Microbulbifer marinus]|uniref:Pilus assembly protein FimV n=1 Tax=Microbulbifer marinus TaxID=658218 RepID=A0A1H3WTC1_9GAMM|nr:FimV/HubP family polar landmark protein [Microbulbifer marinus]SDZ90379.1 pilus assembly protein FimV [Microbulbifer marinus]